MSVIISGNVRLGTSGTDYTKRGLRIGCGPQWWDEGGISDTVCLAAWQPKNAASLAASYTNLKKPGTYDLTGTTPPTWNASQGWICASSVKRLDLSDMVLGTAHTTIALIKPTAQLPVYYFGPLTGDGSSNTSSLAVAGDATTVTFLPYTTGSAGRDATVSNIVGSIVVVAAARNGTSVDFYLNGVKQTTNAGTMQNNPFTMKTLLYRNGGIGYTGEVRAIAAYNAVLTDAQIARISDKLKDI